jgi:uncharacterized protein YcfL
MKKGLLIIFLGLLIFAGCRGNENRLKNNIKG